MYKKISEKCMETFMIFVGRRNWNDKYTDFMGRYRFVKLAQLILTFDLNIDSFLQLILKRAEQIAITLKNCLVIQLDRHSNGTVRKMLASVQLKKLGFQLHRTIPIAMLRSSSKRNARI